MKRDAGQYVRFCTAMSETWGPRAHPERCCEDIEPEWKAEPGMTGYPPRHERRVRKSIAELLGTLLGVASLVAVAIGIVGIVVATRENWWAALLIWWREVSGAWG